jgi:hypothetical protein
MINRKTHKKIRSNFKSMLIDKCKNVFERDQTEFFEKYKNSEERQQIMRQYRLGIVNFISELIIQKILIKKVVFKCIEHLFQNVNPINIEGIIILLDKFGTSINKNDIIKPKDLSKYNEQINNHLMVLNLIQENDETFPRNIRFKIINLIDKRDRGWRESNIDLSKSINSKTAFKEENVNEITIKGGFQETTSKSKLDYDEVILLYKISLSNI